MPDEQTSTPATVPAAEQAAAATPSAAAETVSQVEAAIPHVEAAAASAPTDATTELLTGVKDVLVRVEGELKRSNDLAEKATKKPEQTVAHAAPAAPTIVAPAAKEERRVFRNGRWVKRPAKG